MKFKIFFASLIVFCVCGLFGRNNSFAFYPKEHEWKTIENDIRVQKVMKASKDYLKIENFRYRQAEICSNIRTLRYFIKENYPEMSSERCEAIARFKLIEPYLYLFFDYDLHRFRYLIEKSNNENEVIEELGREILDNCDDKFVTYLVYDICTLCTSYIN